jgi:hypothetical protein
MSLRMMPRSSEASPAEGNPLKTKGKPEEDTMWLGLVQGFEDGRGFLLTSKHMFGIQEP